MVLFHVFVELGRNNMFERNILDELLESLKLIKINSDLISNEFIVGCDGDFNQLFSFFVNNHILKHIKIDFERTAYSCAIFNDDKYPIEYLRIESGEESLKYGTVSLLSKDERILLTNFDIFRRNNLLEIRRRISSNLEVESYENLFENINDFLKNKINDLNLDIQKYNYLIKQYSSYHAERISRHYKSNPSFYGKR